MSAAPCNEQPGAATVAQLPSVPETADGQDPHFSAGTDPCCGEAAQGAAINPNQAITKMAETRPEARF